MRKQATLKEKLFMSAVKGLPCIICSAPPPSEAHHVCDTGRRLGNMFCLPLCTKCHRGNDGFSGINRTAWDKSLNNQLFLLRVVCKKLKVQPPEYKTKVVKRWA